MRACAYQYANTSRLRTATITYPIRFRYKHYTVVQSLDCTVSSSFMPLQIHWNQRNKSYARSYVYAFKRKTNKPAFIPLQSMLRFTRNAKVTIDCNLCFYDFVFYDCHFPLCTNAAAVNYGYWIWQMEKNNVQNNKLSSQNDYFCDEFVLHINI